MAFNLDEKYIIKAEEDLGLPLPDDYRKSMMEENGGERDVSDEIWWLNPIFDTSDRKRLKRSTNHIIRETEAIAEYSHWPKNALYIANNGSGDALLFLRNDLTYGPEIFRWCHETGNTEKVANSFGDLK